MNLTSVKRSFVVVLFLTSACATFHPFRADLGSVDIDGQLVRPPYLSTLRYFGFLTSSKEEQFSVDADASPFVYVWLAHAVPELGIRVVSPSVSLPAPSAHHDIAEATWKEHASERNGFDACVRIERCTVLRDPTQKEARCENWLPLGDNEDSPEVPDGASGQSTNALVRVQSSGDDPLFALVRGLYRIQFARCRDATGTGTFAVELGAPMSLEGAMVARTQAELAERVKGVHAHVPLVAQPARDGFVTAPGQGPYVAPVPDNLAPPEPQAP